MTLRDYLRVFLHRWPILGLTSVIAAAVVFVLSPTKVAAQPPASTYTATATLLISAEPGSNAVTRVPLYITTGEIPRMVAEEVGFKGDPAVLARSMNVVPDFAAMSLQIARTDRDPDRAVLLANTFADVAQKFFAAQGAATGNVQLSMLQRATPIAEPPSNGYVVPPNRVLRTLIAGVLGLFLGLAIALIAERLDSRLRSREDISQAIGVPILAEVPRLSRRQRRSRPILVDSEPLGRYSEGYRAARTALTFAVRGAQGEEQTTPLVVLVTSARPGEGKTTTVANLAASFAESGRSVLVLDGDLREPDAHEIFDVPQGAGISDYLTESDTPDLAAYIRPTNVPGVSIVTAGTQLSNPASAASRVGRLVKTARRHADVVLIDTAPLLAASDVFDVLPLADTVLLVVRSGRLTEAAGQRVAELLGRFEVPVAGVLITAAGSGQPGAYGSVYGYGYGYGYGKGKRKQSRRRSGTKSQTDPRREAGAAGVDGELTQPARRRRRRG